MARKKFVPMMLKSRLDLDNSAVFYGNRKDNYRFFVVNVSR